MEKFTIQQKIKKSPSRKLADIVEVLYRLAIIAGYSPKGEIKDIHGNPVRNSNIVDLVIETFTPGRTLNGKEAYAYQLYKSRFPPEKIKNDEIKSMVVQYYMRPERPISQAIQVEPQVRTQNPPSFPPEENNASLSRTMTADEFFNEIGSSFQDNDDDLLIDDAIVSHGPPHTPQKTSTPKSLEMATPVDDQSLYVTPQPEKRAYGTRVYQPRSHTKSGRPVKKSKWITT